MKGFLAAAAAIAIVFALGCAGLAVHQRFEANYWRDEAIYRGLHSSIMLGNHRVLVEECQRLQKENKALQGKLNDRPPRKPCCPGGQCPAKPTGALGASADHKNK